MSQKSLMEGFGELEEELRRCGPHPAAVPDW